MSLLRDYNYNPINSVLLNQETRDLTHQIQRPIIPNIYGTANGIYNFSQDSFTAHVSVHLSERKIGLFRDMSPRDLRILAGTMVSSENIQVMACSEVVRRLNYNEPLVDYLITSRETKTDDDFALSILENFMKLTKNKSRIPLKNINFGNWFSNSRVFSRLLNNPVFKEALIKEITVIFPDDSSFKGAINLEQSLSASRDINDGGEQNNSSDFTIMLNGKGIKTQPDGMKAEGTFIKGVLEGEGREVFPRVGVRQGQYISGLLNGKGIETFSNGERREGEFVNGILNGKGSEIYSNGDVRKGEFVDGKLNGKGRESFTNGKVIAGDFVNGLLNGDGEITKGNKRKKVNSSMGY